MKHSLHGYCHCGALRYHYDTDVEVITPRACGCSFCQRHGARWHSSPDASLRLVGEERFHGVYRFETATADFHFCTRCAVVLAATSEIDRTTYAVVNLAALHDPGLLAEPVATNFDGEEADMRLQRRRDHWISTVTLEFG